LLFLLPLYIFSYIPRFPLFSPTLSPIVFTFFLPLKFPLLTHLFQLFSQNLSPSSPSSPPPYHSFRLSYSTPNSQDLFSTFSLFFHLFPLRFSRLFLSLFYCFFLLFSLIIATLSLIHYSFFFSPPFSLPSYQRKWLRQATRGIPEMVGWPLVSN
jgi:hypothetical protein